MLPVGGLAYIIYSKANGEVDNITHFYQPVLGIIEHFTHIDDGVSEIELKSKG